MTTYDTLSLFSEVGADSHGSATPPALTTVPTSDLPLDAPVRLTDPDTSVFAARVLDGANDRQIVLEALTAMGGRGTADQITDWLNERGGRVWQRSCVSSRLSQLKDPKRHAGDPPVVDTGLRAKGSTGRPTIVFGVVA